MSMSTSMSTWDLDLYLVAISRIRVSYIPKVPKRLRYLYTTYVP